MPGSTRRPTSGATPATSTTSAAGTRAISPATTPRSTPPSSTTSSPSERRRAACSAARSRARREARDEPRLHRRPLFRQDREAEGIARDEVCGHAVGAQHPLERSADALDRSARALVARIGVETDAQHPPRLEGMGKHEELGLGIGGGANRRTGQPGMADLAGIRRRAAVARMLRRPGPALQVPEARRADHGAVGAADRREGKRGAGIAPGERRLDIARNLVLALGDGAPAIEGGIGHRGRDEAVDVAVVEGLEADVPAFEHDTFCHHETPSGGSRCHREPREGRSDPVSSNNMLDGVVPRRLASARRRGPRHDEDGSYVVAARNDGNLYASPSRGYTSATKPTRDRTRIGHGSGREEMLVRDRSGEAASHDRAPRPEGRRGDADVAPLGATRAFSPHPLGATAFLAALGCSRGDANVAPYPMAHYNLTRAAGPIAPSAPLCHNHLS